MRIVQGREGHDVLDKLLTESNTAGTDHGYFNHIKALLDFL
jgi:hypothetical protein